MGAINEWYWKIQRRLDWHKRGIKVWRYANVYRTARLGNNVSIGAYTEVGAFVTIGKNTRIGAMCFLPEGTRIEHNVFVGPRVTFTNDRYMVVPGDSWQPDRTKWQPILVKQGARIGAGAIILPGVVIGRYAIVGAGAVVVSDVPDGHTVVGVPALSIKKGDDDMGKKKPKGPKGC